MLKTNEAKLMVQVVGYTDEDCRKVELLTVIDRLAKKHHRLAEMECNGEGWLHGKHYYAGTIDKQNSQYTSAYITEHRTVFEAETGKVEAKIADLVRKLGAGWRVEFQGDPRGNTVKVFKGNNLVELA